MFARVVITQQKPDYMDQVIRYYRDVIPKVKELAGFKRAYLLVDRKSGKNLTITQWDTEKNMQAAVVVLDRFIAEAPQNVAPLAPPVIEIYEVVE